MLWWCSQSMPIILAVVRGVMSGRRTRNASVVLEVRLCSFGRTFTYRYPLTTRRRTSSVPPASTYGIMTGRIKNVVCDVMTTMPGKFLHVKRSPIAGIGTVKNSVFTY